MSTIVDFSPIESEVMGLKFGRCNSDQFDESSLYRQIVENRYDVCRLKVPAQDEMASYRLNNTGLPFFFSGSIRRYKTKISERPDGDYNFPNLIFEPYDGSQDTLLKDMLVGTWGTYPLGYYRTPYVQHKVSKEYEIEAVFRYYKKFNLTRDYPDNCILFIKHNDSYVGFFALNIINNNLESHIGGILGPYRKSGYFLDKLRFIKNYCIEHRLDNFIFGARNENAEVQKIFQFVGFQAQGSENVFHLPAMLDFSIRERIVREFKFDILSPKTAYQELLAYCLSLAGYDAENVSFSFHLNNMDSLLKQKQVKIAFSFPVLSENEHLIVMTADANNLLPFTGYFRGYKNKPPLHIL